MNLDQHNHINEQSTRHPQIGDDLLNRLKKMNEDCHLHHDEEVRLKCASGIQAPSILANAIDMGITADNFLAIHLLPIIRIAKADQKIGEKKKKFIYQVATKFGFSKDQASWELIEHWLESDYNPNLTLTWRDFVKVQKEMLSPIEYEELKRGILYKCRKVVKSSGLIGIGPMTKKESEVFRDIEQSF